MAEFVESGHDIVMGQQRRFAFGRAGEIAGQESDRFLQRTGETEPALGVVHPGTTALVLAGMQVNVEMRDGVATAILDIEEAHRRMPAIKIVGLFELDSEQLPGNIEQAIQHFAFRKIRPQLFVANVVFMLAQFLAVIGDVPDLQLAAAVFGFGIRRQLGQIGFGLLARTLGQIEQEVIDLRGALGHFAGQRQGRVIGEAEQLRQFMTRGQRVGNDLCVVELAGLRALIGRARAVSGVNLFAQFAIIGIGHHRQITRPFEGDQVTLHLAGFGAFAGISEGTVRQALERRHIIELASPGHGGIKQLLFEFGAEIGQLLLQFGVAGFFVGWQRDTGQFEIANGFADDMTLGGVQRLILIANGQIGLVQIFILLQLGAVFGQQRQRVVVGLAQCRRVADRMQMADARPPFVQLVLAGFQRRDQIGPTVVRCGSEQLL